MRPFIDGSGYGRGCRSALDGAGEDTREDVLLEERVDDQQSTVVASSVG
jgi:hypothetical protein